MSLDKASKTASEDLKETWGPWIDGVIRTIKDRRLSDVHPDHKEDPVIQHILDSAPDRDAASKFLYILAQSTDISEQNWDKNENVLSKTLEAGFPRRYGSLFFDHGLRVLEQKWLEDTQNAPKNRPWWWQYCKIATKLVMRDGALPRQWFEQIEKVDPKNEDASFALGRLLETYDRYFQNRLVKFNQMDMWRKKWDNESRNGGWMHEDISQDLPALQENLKMFRMALIGILQAKALFAYYPPENENEAGWMRVPTGTTVNYDKDPNNQLLQWMDYAFGLGEETAQKHFHGGLRTLEQRIVELQGEVPDSPEQVEVERRISAERSVLNQRLQAVADKPKTE